MPTNINLHYFLPRVKGIMISIPYFTNDHGKRIEWRFLSFWWDKLLNSWHLTHFVQILYNHSVWSANNSLSVVLYLRLSALLNDYQILLRVSPPLHKWLVKEWWILSVAKWNLILSWSISRNGRPGASLFFPNAPRRFHLLKNVWWVPSSLVVHQSSYTPPS